LSRREVFGAGVSLVCRGVPAMSLTGRGMGRKSRDAVAEKRRRWANAQARTQRAKGGGPGETPLREKLRGSGEAKQKRKWPRRHRARPAPPGIRVKSEGGARRKLVGPKLADDQLCLPGQHVPDSQPVSHPTPGLGSARAYLEPIFGGRPRAGGRLGWTRSSRPSRSSTGAEKPLDCPAFALPWLRILVFLGSDAHPLLSPPPPSFPPPLLNRVHHYVRYSENTSR
jgi:hypothetical protein